jgi:hypothetical protein
MLLTGEADRHNSSHPNRHLLRKYSVKTLEYMVGYFLHIEDRVMLQNEFRHSPDALAHNGDETIAMRRPMTITDDTWPAELAKTRLWKLAFTPSGLLVYGFDRSSAVEKWL